MPGVASVVDNTVPAAKRRRKREKSEVSDADLALSLEPSPDEMPGVDAVSEENAVAGANGDFEGAKKKRKRSRADVAAAHDAEIAAAITGERMMTKYTGGRGRPSRDEIARLAYHFYETRGRRDGQDIDDWLSAERKLTQQDEAHRPRLEADYSLALPDEALETALRLW